MFLTDIATKRADGKTVKLKPKKQHSPSSQPFTVLNNLASEDVVGAQRLVNSGAVLPRGRREDLAGHGAGVMVPAKGDSLR
jgi:hypothetical protein